MRAPEKPDGLTGRRDVPRPVMLRSNNVPEPSGVASGLALPPREL